MLYMHTIIYEPTLSQPIASRFNVFPPTALDNNITNGIYDS